MGDNSSFGVVAILDTVGGVGVFAAVENFLIIMVFLTNRRLLNCSSLLILLTIAHTVNGVVHSILYFWPAYYQFINATPIYCMEVFYPNLFLTTYQFIPFVLALCGLERLLAMGAPLWYRAKCTHRRLWFVSLGAFFLAIFLLIINSIKIWSNPLVSVPANCYLPQIMGVYYMVFGAHFPACLGGVCAITCTTMAVFIGGRRIRNMPSNSDGEIKRIKRQIRLTKCLLMVSGIDFIFAVIPNVILLLFNLDLITFPLEYIPYVILLYCLDSALNVFAFLIFNKDFRSACLKLLLCRKSTVTLAESTTAVQKLFVNKY